MWNPSRPANHRADPGDSGTRSHAALVVADDGADLPYAGVLVIKTAGVVKVTTVGGEDVVLDVPVGVLPLEVKRVWATGLTAAITCVLY